MILASNPKFSLNPFEESLKKVEKEFNGWEILAEKYHNLDHRAKIKDALSTTDIEVQVHAPLNDINIASINEEMRKASVQEVKKSIELGSTIGAKIVTVHPGLYSPLSVYWDGATDTAKKSLRELQKYAEEMGVTLALENLPKMWLSMCSTSEETRDFLTELDIEFCLDIGHANTADELDEFLDFSPINVHIHDNVGENDVHLKMGEGEISFKHALKNLKDYEGNFVIEGRNMEELVESKIYLKQLLSEIDIG